MSDAGQLKTSRAMILFCAVVAYILATQVSSVLGALMVALTMFAPYAILMTAMFLWPKTVKNVGVGNVFGRVCVLYPITILGKVAGNFRPIDLYRVHRITGSIYLVCSFR